MNPNENPFRFTPPKEEDLPECDERAYWHKRFNFASWIFLLWGFYLIIFSDGNGKAILFSLLVSVGFQLFDSICQARHMLWHIRKDGGGRDFR